MNQPDQKPKLSVLAARLSNLITVSEDMCNWCKGSLKQIPGVSIEISTEDASNFPHFMGIPVSYLHLFSGKQTLFELSCGQVCRGTDDEDLKIFLYNLRGALAGILKEQENETRNKAMELLFKEFRDTARYVR